MRPSFSRFLARVVNTPAIRRHDFLRQQYEAALAGGPVSYTRSCTMGYSIGLQGAVSCYLGARSGRSLAR